MTYKVSFHPERGWRWWHPAGPYRFGGEYCDTAVEQHVRDATDEEIAVIKRIEAAAHHNRPAHAVVAKFIALAQNTPLI